MTGRVAPDPAACGDRTAAYRPGRRPVAPAIACPPGADPREVERKRSAAWWASLKLAQIAAAEAVVAALAAKRPTFANAHADESRRLQAMIGALEKAPRP